MVIVKKLLAKIVGVLLSTAKKKIKIAALRWALRKIMRAIADTLVRMIGAALKKGVDNGDESD